MQEIGQIKWKCLHKNKNLLQADVQSVAMFGNSLISDAHGNSIYVADKDHYMTKARDYFATYTAFEKPKLITLGNHSAFMMIYGQDDINVETFVLINVSI